MFDPENLNHKLRDPLSFFERFLVRFSLAILFLFSIVFVCLFSWHEIRIRYIEATRFTVTDGAALRGATDSLRVSLEEMHRNTTEQNKLMQTLITSQTELLRNQQNIVEMLLPFYPQAHTLEKDKP